MRNGWVIPIPMPRPLCGYANSALGNGLHRPPRPRSCPPPPSPFLCRKVPRTAAPLEAAGGRIPVPCICLPVPCVRPPQLWGIHPLPNPDGCTGGAPRPPPPPPPPKPTIRGDQACRRAPLKEREHSFCPLPSSPVSRQFEADGFSAQG